MTDQHPTKARARRRGSRPARAVAGQSLVEFAIGLPLLLALVIAIFEFGRAWNTSQVLTNAAREGARHAVLETTESEGEVTDVISAYVDNAGLDPGLVTVTIDGFDADVGEPLTLQVDYPYEFALLGPIVAFLGDGGGDVPGSVTLSPTVVMRNE